MRHVCLAHAANATNPGITVPIQVRRNAVVIESQRMKRLLVRLKTMPHFPLWHILSPRLRAMVAQWASDMYTLLQDQEDSSEAACGADILTVYE